MEQDILAVDGIDLFTPMANDILMAMAAKMYK